MDQLTKCCALELASKGIRVNGVNPGTVDTDVYIRGGMSLQDYNEYLKESANSHPLGRVGKPEDVAQLIEFVSSEKANWITGQIFIVDGGKSLVSVGSGKASFEVPDIKK